MLWHTTHQRGAQTAKDTACMQRSLEGGERIGAMGEDGRRREGGEGRRGRRSKRGERGKEEEGGAWQVHTRALMQVACIHLISLCAFTLDTH